MSRAHIWAPDLPEFVKMPSGHAIRARVVLWEAIGDLEVVRCHWCRRELVWERKGVANAIEADHLDGDVTNDDPANIVAADRRCNQRRGAGLLWWYLRRWPRSRYDYDEVTRWGPIKVAFACGHEISEDNAYRIPGKREHGCLQCHRQRARDHWRAKHPDSRRRVP